LPGLTVRLIKGPGALLGMQEERLLQTENAMSRSKGLPYDNQRLELFTQLALTLQSQIFLLRKVKTLL
jgi:hypothetical protein